MSLEEQIIEWAKSRPAWQRLILRQAATANLLSDEHYEDFIDGIVAGRWENSITFGLDHLPQVAAEDPPIRLVSIAEPEHVNALASEEPLTFARDGLTIIYGDNGSGKSGYARLLKRITRARHREDVLTNVFLDTSLDKPTAHLSVLIGNKHHDLSWPDSTPPELQRMLFYDGACGFAYISTESDFPYRPSAIFVMDCLIDACVEVRSRIDKRLYDNAASAVNIPIVVDEIKETEAGKFLQGLSGNVSITKLDALIKEFVESDTNIDDLKKHEAHLRKSDTSNERQNLRRQAEKLDALSKHIQKIHTVLGDEALTALQERRDRLQMLEEAAVLVAKSFESEPLHGVGNSPWKLLWESAKRYSELHAYPTLSFPVLAEGSRCVLCQQTLDEKTRHRFSKFDRFIKEDTQVQLKEVRELYDLQCESLAAFLVLTEVTENNLADLQTSHKELINHVRQFLGMYQDLIQQTRDALQGTEPLRFFGIDTSPILSQLVDAAKSAREEAEGLSNPEIVLQRLASISSKRKEFELLQQIKNSRETIIEEIERLKEREALEAAKTAAATGPITKKILDLSEESITEVVRDTFTRETERLGLDRVTIARTRGEKGILLHQPKLVGARQTVMLPRVFSEGERTALGLAAFFTEVLLDQSKSAIILDDPVTSLDHVRRGLVASKLTDFAQTRQVIVFTHDVSFVADLKREAKTKGVSVAERSVSRSRSKERKPGICTSAHPWKAKDVGVRLNELRQELAEIKNNSNDLDQTAYEDAIGHWAGKLSETWERIFSQEIVGPILAEGGLEVRPRMVKILACFSDSDYNEFEVSYYRTSQWATRHDKSAAINYVAPELDLLTEELTLVESWFKRVKGYKG